MTDWRKYEVPDWVVDDYNSRVSEKDRILLDSYSDMETEDDWIPSNDKVRSKASKSNPESFEQEVPKLGTAIKNLIITLLKLLGELFLFVLMSYIFFVIVVGLCRGS